MAIFDGKPLAAEWLFQPRIAGFSAVAIGILTVAAYSVWRETPDRVPALKETIPYVSNAYQYMTDMRSFLRRARKALADNNIVQFNVGPMKIYMVSGARNIQVLFRSTQAVSSDKFMIMVTENISGATKPDVAKYIHDRSGRLPKPAPGTENTPEDKRVWSDLHRLIHENLQRPAETNKLAESYQKFFDERLEMQPLGEWTTVRVFEFLKKDMATAAITALTGPRIFEITPDLLDALWEFDEIAASLVWGLPRWMNRKAYVRRERFHKACGDYLESAWANFDPYGPEADVDWEPNFGCRFMREMAKWMKKSNFSPRTCAGTVGTLGIFGQNSNSIPVATWCVMEVAKDQELLQAVRKEADSAFVIDPVTSKRKIDAQKLITLPLLQSIYAEAMRLHVSINITREIMEPIKLDGYTLEKGAILQASSELAGYDERIWGVEGHPASEFWPARHIKQVEVEDEDGKLKLVPQFSMAGRSNEFIPYGGGISMCAGRFFAKQEIMMTFAILVSRFDIEFIEWTTLDGKPSDRPAEDDERWSGGASVPPDRDMKVRWKRLW